MAAGGVAEAAAAPRPDAAAIAAIADDRKSNHQGWPLLESPKFPLVPRIRASTVVAIRDDRKGDERKTIVSGGRWV